MNKTQQQARSAKFEALRERIRAGGNLDPQSLSRSYGLPVADVSGLIKDMTNA